MSDEMVMIYKSINALAESEDLCGTDALTGLYEELRSRLYQRLGEAFAAENETALAIAMDPS